ncbi:FixH family protein [Virgibacillus siamensis]|uniref:FixH family protein n=1 Tax=Virgibacillus siamensis TaxID=480071 RepID=A0ABP3QF28_9BACI
MKKIILLILTAVVLAACGQTNNTSNSSDEVVQPIQADLQVPKRAEPGKKITFKVTVTQNEKAVNDADEVKFEIWQEGSKSNSEMVKAKHTKNGIYIVKKTFDQKGIYYVQSHVTARQMHTMPKAKINIGNAKKKDTTKKEHNRHHSQTKVEFQPPEKITKGEEAAFTANVSTKHEPLSDASVTMEIWQKNSKKHEWVNMEETSSGRYEAKTTFKNKGNYQIKVHVKKDEIHYHNVFEVNVK